MAGNLILVSIVYCAIVFSFVWGPELQIGHSNHAKSFVYLSRPWISREVLFTVEAFGKVITYQWVYEQLKWLFVMINVCVQIE